MIMVDFVNSFHEGINVGEISAKNKQEINSVLVELTNQLFQASGGKISIFIDDFDERKNELYRPFTVFGMPISIPEDSRYHRKPNMSIVAWNPNHKKSIKVLAKWRQSPSGFPCKIIFSGNEIICEDKLALEAGLSELLKSPEVGEHLFNLMNLSAEKNQDDEQEVASEED